MRWMRWMTRFGSRALLVLCVLLYAGGRTLCSGAAEGHALCGGWYATLALVLPESVRHVLKAMRHVLKALVLKVMRCVLLCTHGGLDGGTNALKESCSTNVELRSVLHPKSEPKPIGPAWTS